MLSKTILPSENARVSNNHSSDEVFSRLNQTKLLFSVAADYTALWLRKSGKMLQKYLQLVWCFAVISDSNCIVREFSTLLTPLQLCKIRKFFQFCYGENFFDNLMTNKNTEANPNQTCRLKIFFESQSNNPWSQKSQQIKSTETDFRWVILSK